MWFETLTGFEEKSPEQVRENISVINNKLKSKANNREFSFGTLETPSLKELRRQVQESEAKKGEISIREEIADVQELHKNESNAGCLFQVASQFNLLEMVSPGVSPERGVNGYEYDLTQGPACAIAAGAGTIYRNYFASVNDEVGQTTHNQIDCLQDIGQALGNTRSRLWEMRNGYALASEKGLLEIRDKLNSASETEKDELRQLLRIGLQKDTEVTISAMRHEVTQAYCSALPVAYSHHPDFLWTEFAKLILEAAYEATFCAAILNSLAPGNNRFYLTLLGGGAFGNKSEWILDAIKRSLKLYKDIELDVVIVSHGKSNKEIQKLISELSN